MLGKRYSLAGLAILLVAVSALIAQQTSTPANFAGARLVVVDSTGKNMGPVIGAVAGGGVTIAVPFHGKLLPIGVGRSSYSQDVLNFTTSDCTGQPFQDVSSGPFLRTTVSGTENTLFVENGPMQSITVMSQLYPSPLGCQQLTFTDSNMAPMTPVTDLNKIFTPPFSVVVK